MSSPTPLLKNPKVAGVQEPAGPILGAIRTLLGLLRFILIGLILYYLASGITVVQPGENALILRLGKLQPEVYPPGLLLAWPQPFDRVLRVPGQQVREVTLNDWSETRSTSPDGAPRAPLSRGLSLHPVTDGYTLTGDRNILRGEFSGRYRVVQPARFALGLEDPGALISGLFYRSLTHTLATQSVDAALSERRQEWILEVIQRTQEQADALELGIEVLAFEVNELVPPASVLPAFQEVINAKVEAETSVQNALSLRARQLPESEARAFRLRAEADASARSLLLQAQAQVETFAALLKAAETNPGGKELFLLQRQVESLRRVWPRFQNVTLLPTGEHPLQILLPGGTEQ